jgi:Aminotransferase class-V
MKETCVRTGAQLIIVEIHLPIESPKSITDALRSAITNRTRIVVLDQITSNTAIMMPIADLALISKEAGAVVVIDGAHSLFSQDCSIYKADQKLHNPSEFSPSLAGINGTQTKLSIADIADVWLTNAHKWMCSPKGCAFMWVHPRLALSLRPAIISHGYAPNELQSDGDQVSICIASITLSMACCKPNISCQVLSSILKKVFRSLFIQDSLCRYIAPNKLLSSYAWDGCRDYAALLCMPSALSLWGSLALSLRERGSKSDDSSSSSSSSYSSSKHTKDSQEPTATSSSLIAHPIDLTNIREFNHTTLLNATEMLSHEWGVTVDSFAAPYSMRIGSPMSLVSNREESMPHLFI